LRRAWQHCRRASWPDTFEEAMGDALLSRLVRITAMHPPRAIAKAAPTQQRPRPAYQRPQHWPPELPPLFDRKRAAAGDVDD
jgi:hypothetical protein